MDKSHPTEAFSEAGSDLCKAELVEKAPGGSDLLGLSEQQKVKG